MSRFDGAQYWRDRLARYPGLQGTGTSFLPRAWQEWLYLGKDRALRALLADHHVNVIGARVLDFGCGTGHFEDFFERAGAVETAGVDVVPAAIAALQTRAPHRTYVCADLAHEATALAGLGRFDLVTAIDVAYHIVDDDALARTLDVLLAALRPGGCFIVTDALRARAPHPHVRFRTLAEWEANLDRVGVGVVGRRPMSVASNRPHPLARVVPDLAGALAYHADRVLVRVAPSLANNWIVLARKRE